MVILAVILLSLMIYAICKVNKLIIKILLLIPTIIIGLGFVMACILANIPALNNGGI